MPIKSISYYNSLTWGMAQEIFWCISQTETETANNTKISNQNSHKRGKEGPICINTLKDRWQFMGYILHLSNETPVEDVMLFFLETSEQGFLCRSQETIPKTLNKDLERKMNNVIYKGKRRLMNR